MELFMGRFANDKRRVVIPWDNIKFIEDHVLTGIVIHLNDGTKMTLDGTLEALNQQPAR